MQGQIRTVPPKEQQRAPGDGGMIGFQNTKPPVFQSDLAKPPPCSGPVREDALLRDHLFDSLRHARNLVAAWRTDFNNDRPHSNLAGMTPAEYVNWSKEDQNLNRANL